MNIHSTQKFLDMYPTDNIVHVHKEISTRIFIAHSLKQDQVSEISR